ncbi:MAG TPA: CocE/NonD family hydrolase [Solirubrobacterales bacterium]|nr:CocE/NonD family hydrolase [Solirubrobacterales bacterium]
MGSTRIGTAMGGGAALALALALVALALPAAAQANFADLYGGEVTCAVQSGNDNVRLCSGKATTWDHKTKIDVNVILPPTPADGADGPYPVIGDFHGWRGSKLDLSSPQTQSWAEQGYVVFSMSDRGWGESCGSADPGKSQPECEEGFNHLMDDRYEVRDAQYLISVLADEGLAEPQRIGVTGMSYGGGISMALAALRNRTMLPAGSLVPWTSPAGKAMEIAAAVPQWPWSDLAYSLMPNGRTLDYVADAPYRGPSGDAPIGVEKLSYVSGLYGTGLAESNYAIGKEPDLTAWYALINAGEPYNSNPLAAQIVETIEAYHSSYYIDHSEPPAPLLIQSGWNDDLFPPDEALRLYNRTRTQYPGDPISLFFMDDGHARSQNKPADLAVFTAREDAWFDHYLKGAGAAPQSSVEALTTTCGTPSEGPYTADDWKDISPGEIRFDSEAAQTVVPGSGDPGIGTTFDPIAGGEACATASGADQTGVATYRLGAVPSPGFTLLGSPTIVADLAPANSESELAARLLDVSPSSGEERLVARGVLRPGAGGHMVFQLHPQAYRFAAGDIPKLELLPSDSPYLRPANTEGPIAVSNLELRLPVLEGPGALGGLVQAPAPKVVPPGYELAGDYRPAEGSGEGGGGTPSSGGTKVSHRHGGKRHRHRKPGRGTIGLSHGRIGALARVLIVPVHCTGKAACSGELLVRGNHRDRPGTPGSPYPRRLLARGGYSVPAGRAARLRVPLTEGGRATFAARRHHRGRRGRVMRAHFEFDQTGRRAVLRLSRPVHLRVGRRHRSAPR